MILHTGTDFPHYDQIDQSIDKWEFIMWTPALGKGKEDWIPAIWFDLFCCITMMNIRKVTFNDIDVFPVWQREMMSAYGLMGWLCMTSRQVLRNLRLKQGERIWGVLFLGLEFFMESLIMVFLFLFLFWCSPQLSLLHCLCLPYILSGPTFLDEIQHFLKMVNNLVVNNWILLQIESYSLESYFKFPFNLNTMFNFTGGL